jgi:AbrB family looped-hinge helix DNA binding protein
MKASLPSPHLTRLSSKGQFIIPKRLRHYIGLKYGDYVILDVRGGQLTIVKQRQGISEKTAGSLAGCLQQGTRGSRKKGRQ